MKTSHISYPLTAMFVLLFGLFGTAAAQVTATTTAATTATAPTVGEATLVIGQAQIVRAGAQPVPVERGSLVRVGDVIQTQIGGHVHLRFVDGGRVSVRPSSRLQIENYAHSEQQPQLSAIKFRLDEGVVRSITGSWGEAARERFRLNTPLAAIGVKGTDFIVRATSDTTAATVFTGAITVAPLKGGCIDSLGPCLNGGEIFLSENMKGQMVELARLQTSSQLVPAVDLMVASLPKIQNIAPTAPGKNQTTEPTVLAAAADKSLLGEALAASVVSNLGAGESPAPTLSWARYPWAQQLAGDDFSQQFEIAMLESHEKLGSNGAYVLLRQTVEDSAPAFAPVGGVAKFQLASAAAHVVRGAQFEAIQVDSAVLNVNFNNATFDTRLQASGPQLGVESVHAAGKISANGSMQPQSSNVHFQGGFSATGQEAGYSFQKSVPNGVLQGITLWGR